MVEGGNPMDEEKIMEQMTEHFNSLPMNMSVGNVAEFLGVCPATAYKIAKSKGFPRLCMPGRKLVIIPKHLFLEWYKENCLAQKTL